MASLQCSPKQYLGLLFVSLLLLGNIHIAIAKSIDAFPFGYTLDGVFDVNPSSGKEPLQVSLNAQVTSVLDENGDSLLVSELEYIWQFDDPNIAELQGNSQTVEFSIFGAYEIILLVKHHDTIVGIGKETVAISENQPPVANFKISNLNPGQQNAPYTINVDASTSTDPDVPNNGSGTLLYKWVTSNGLHYPLPTGNPPQISTTADPYAQFTFNQAGTFEITLTVIDTGGKTDSITQTVHIKEPTYPTAFFTVSTESNSNIAPVRIFLNPAGSADDEDDPSTGYSNLAKYEWTITAPDNQPVFSGSTITNITKNNAEEVDLVLPVRGRYRISLTVRDKQNWEDTANIHYYVGGNTPPNAAATVVPTRAILNVPSISVQMDGSTSSDPDDATYTPLCDWLVNGTSVSSNCTHTHLFTASGVYNVKLKVTDLDGYVDYSQEVVIIDPPIADNIPPVAEPVVTLESYPSCPITVDGAASLDLDGNITDYAWTYTPETDALTIGGQQATLAFPTAGQHLVTLTVTDNAGGQHSAAKTVVIHSLPTVSVIAPARTSYSETATVLLESSIETNAVHSEYIRYEWTAFGGALLDANESVTTVELTQPGTYQVRLNAWLNAPGCPSDIPLTVNNNNLMITVAEPTPDPDPILKYPDANLTLVTPPTGPPPQVIELDSSTSTDDGEIVKYLMEVGSQSCQSRKCKFDLKTSGEHIVKLTITDNDGLTSVTTRTVTVPVPTPDPTDPGSGQNPPDGNTDPDPADSQQPTANFNMDPKPEGPAPQRVGVDGNLSATSEGSIIDYEWKTSNPAHRCTQAKCDFEFDTPGDKFIELTVTNSGGFTDSEVKTFRLCHPPIAEFQSIYDPEQRKYIFDGSLSKSVDDGELVYQWHIERPLELETNDDSMVVAQLMIDDTTPTGMYRVSLTVILKVDGDGYQYDCISEPFNKIIKVDEEPPECLYDNNTLQCQICDEDNELCQPCDRNECSVWDTVGRQYLSCAIFPDLCPSSPPQGCFYQSSMASCLDCTQGDCQACRKENCLVIDGTGTSTSCRNNPALCPESPEPTSECLYNASLKMCQICREGEPCNLCPLEECVRIDDPEVIICSNSPRSCETKSCSEKPEGCICQSNQPQECKTEGTCTGQGKGWWNGQVCMAKPTTRETCQGNGGWWNSLMQICVPIPTDKDTCVKHHGYWEANNNKCDTSIFDDLPKMSKGKKDAFAKILTLEDSEPLGFHGIELWGGIILEGETTFKQEHSVTPDQKITILVKLVFLEGAKSHIGQKNVKFLFGLSPEPIEVQKMGTKAEYTFYDSDKNAMDLTRLGIDLTSKHSGSDGWFNKLETLFQTQGVFGTIPRLSQEITVNLWQDKTFSNEEVGTRQYINFGYMLLPEGEDQASSLVYNSSVMIIEIVPNDP